MAKSISGSVGRWGVNRKADVQTVQGLLNNAGVMFGGPVPLLVVDGLCGPKTIAAIQKFQMFHFGGADGRVDPGHQTIEKLNQFDKGGGAQPPPPGGDLTQLRRKIIGIAKQQATPRPGKVSDMVTMIDAGSGKTFRKGWRHLKDYFDVAVVGWGPRHWKDPNVLAGVQIPGKRVPQSKGKGMQWCGIFATWVLIKAGMNARWTIGKGINLPRVYGKKDAKPGDVCVTGPPRYHHFIVIGGGDVMTTVNGNSDNQSILIKPVSRQSIACYYKVD